MAKKSSKKQLSEENAALLAAVKMATAIQKGSSLSERQSHCRFFNGYVIATNDVLIIGVPTVGLAVECCPHSKTLIAALERCQGETTFTLDGVNLVVKSGRIRVPVPCIEPQALADLTPDSAMAPCGQAEALAIATVAEFVEQDAEKLVHKPVYFGPNLAQGTYKGFVAVQVWHGNPNLPSLALPQETAKAIAKHASGLTAIAQVGGTATFWFADNSFVKTSLYDIRSPDFDRALEKKSQEPESDITAEFWEAVKTMQPFTTDRLGAALANEITFSDGKIWAGQSHDGNASFDYPNPPIDECSVNCTHLLHFEGLADKIYADNHENKVYLFGNGMRGVIAGILRRGR